VAVPSPYSDDQREACVALRLGKGLTFARVAQMAAHGELRTDDGRRLPPFIVPEDTVRTWVNRARKRAAGEVSTPLATMDPKDAVENLRLRCVNASAKLLEDFERQLKSRSRKKPPDPVQLQKIIRVVREAAALPGPGDPRPSGPGRAARNSLRDGPAALLLKDAMAGDAGAQEFPPSNGSGGP
jgi:hypothetical protein